MVHINIHELMNFVNTSSYVCYINFYPISFMSSISFLYHKIQMKKACLWRNFWSTFLWDSMTTVWKWTMWVLCLPVATHYTSMQRRSSQYKICLLIVVFLEFMDYIVNPQCMHFRHSCKNCRHRHLPRLGHSNKITGFSDPPASSFWLLALFRSKVKLITWSHLWPRVCKK